jgi:K+-transporting ATPase KdpF subunit
MESASLWLAGILTIAVLAYLVYALLFPENLE